ncbi:uncharacterized protein YjbK [Oikeobacillus pervagus]|uniref:Uncharacterized protein YjbK n=1 Tax=Oikeobacillus pervagus TaxID=1325931 RepID=A0AAJ1T2T7_9BACI|nr:CYTH domain-containing protein [Oikeobacillus pervagus]MDQ0215651.1 uncharacterized protein YjbK [Oikeobacillus pervagus]
MPNEIEIEFKNLLEQEEFENLLASFQIQEQNFITQENYYFDTPDFQLKEKNCALRIRCKQGNFELTLKQPHTVGLLETNQPIDAACAHKIIEDSQIPLGEVREQLNKLQVNINKIQCFGSLQTKRAEIPYHEGILVFDSSYYLHQQDFEIEYEVNQYDIGQKYFFQLLKEFNIPKRTTDNKIQRFYKEKLRQKKH